MRCTMCHILEGFIVSMLLLVPTIAMLKEYASTPVHREIGINSVVQCSSPARSIDNAFVWLKEHSPADVTAMP